MCSQGEGLADWRDRQDDTGAVDELVVCAWDAGGYGECDC